MQLASRRVAGACHACHVLETQRHGGGSGVGFRHDLTRGKVRSASSCFSPKTIRSDHQQWRQGCHRCTRCASVRRPLRGTCVPHALLLAVHGADRARGDKGDRKTIAAKVRDRGDDLTYWGVPRYERTTTSRTEYDSSVGASSVCQGSGISDAC